MISPKHLNRRFIFATAFLATMLAGACSDPYSQRRIARRWESFDRQVKRMEKREIDAERRVEEDLDTLRKWWKRDCERFERKAPTVGDYFW